MSVSKLAKTADGRYKCPACSEALTFADGGQVRVVNGKVDYDNVKPRYICYKCKKYYRELLNTDFYDIFDLDQAEYDEYKKAHKSEEKHAKGHNRDAGKKTKQKKNDSNPVVALKKNAKGICSCPVCNGDLTFVDGGQVRVVNGQVDYENVKPRYVCYECKSFYRELLSSGLFEVFDLPPEEQRKMRAVKKTGDLMPMQLKADTKGICECPRCGADMHFVEAGAVKIVNGRADMSDTVPHFACEECSSVYRRIASTDYYQWSEA